MTLRAWGMRLRDNQAFWSYMHRIIAVIRTDARAIAWALTGLVGIARVPLPAGNEPEFFEPDPHGGRRDVEFVGEVTDKFVSRGFVQAF